MTMAKKTKKASSEGVVVDFSKAKGGGGNKRYPEADYKFKFTAWELVGKKEDPDEKGFKVTLQFSEGKYKGQKIIDRLWLQDNTLWRLRLFIEAMGVDVPDKKAKVNLDKYVGNELGATLVDNEYKGRVSSQVGDYIDLETLAGADEDDEDEDEEETEDDDDEDEDEEDLEEFDADDL
jgi:cobalamin biosynthesis protein CobT